MSHQTVAQAAGKGFILKAGDWSESNDEFRSEGEATPRGMWEILSMMEET